MEEVVTHGQEFSRTTINPVDKDNNVVISMRQSGIIGNGPVVITGSNAMIGNARECY